MNYPSFLSNINHCHWDELLESKREEISCAAIKRKLMGVRYFDFGWGGYYPILTCVNEIKYSEQAKSIFCEIDKDHQKAIDFLSV